MNTLQLVPFGFNFSIGTIASSNGIQNHSRQPGMEGLIFDALPSFDDLVKASSFNYAFFLIPECNPYSHYAASLWNLNIPTASVIGNSKIIRAGDFVLVDYENCIIEIVSDPNEYLMLKKKLEIKTKHLISTKTNNKNRFSVMYEVSSIQEIESLCNNKMRLSVIKPEIFLKNYEINQDSINRFNELISSYPHPIYFRFFDTFGKYQDNGLGYRGIRLLKLDDSIFDLYTKILLSLRSKKLVAVFPMVSSINEIMEIKGKLSGIVTHIGVTIETPAAALIVDDIIDQVDFVEIGTNDLTQFIMAWNRNIPNKELLPHDNLPQPVSIVIKKIIQTCCSAKKSYCLGIDLKPTNKLASQLVGLSVSSISCPNPLGKYWETY